MSARDWMNRDSHIDSKRGRKCRQSQKRSGKKETKRHKEKERGRERTKEREKKWNMSKEQEIEKIGE